MNDNYQHIEKLYASFKESMLPAISKGDAGAFECLEKSHIETNGNTLPIEFNMGNLFNAIWCWGNENGVTLPDTSDFESEFKYFWSLLTNPWPINEFQKSGLSVKPKKTSGAKAGHTYELSSA